MADFKVTKPVTSNNGSQLAQALTQIKEEEAALLEVAATHALKGVDAFDTALNRIVEAHSQGLKAVVKRVLNVEVLGDYNTDHLSKFDEKIRLLSQGITSEPIQDTFKGVTVESLPGSDT
jgi:hypothetical protein